MLLQLAEPQQKLKVCASTYQASLPQMRKYLLRKITALKLLIRHLQDHQSISAAPLNHSDPHERAITYDATHRISTHELPPELIISTVSISVPINFSPEPNNIPSTKSTDTASKYTTDYPSQVPSPLSARSTPPSGISLIVQVDFPFDTQQGHHNSIPPYSSPPKLPS